jgi:predicted kinase
MVSAIEAGRGWLAERSAAGCVRRCHGDLHLGNVCLWEGKPVAFDALEFDEELATIDVGYDLAFLLMDLDRRVGREAANRVMNRYVARTGDLAMRGFPMFLSQRAMIRAHVLKAMNQDGDAYLAAARNYLDPSPAMVVAIGGLQGTGKSTLARALAPGLGAAPGAVVLRSDEIRKRLHGSPPEGRLGPEAYGDAANTATNGAVVAQARLVALSGHSLIVDATFLDPAVRRDLAAAVPAGVPFLGIWLQAPLALLEARVGSREGDASDATVAVLRRAAAIDPGPGDWLAVDASDGVRALAAVRDAINRRG